jgi:hypothetical protein
MYDLIGDLHGHADTLHAMLHKLGYREEHGVYRHPERRVLFLGDFIDRGPKIRETLDIVRAMVDTGAARAVLGNHEWNALAFETPDPHRPGEYLRPHNPKNVHQIRQTVAQLNDSQRADWLAWFRTLPLWHDEPEIRAVHACWAPASMRRLVEFAGVTIGNIPRATDELLIAGNQTGSPIMKAAEIVLKGKETPLPEGITYTDKDGTQRHQARVRWYLPTQGYRLSEYCFGDAEGADVPLPDRVHTEAEPYPADAPPVFVGHYWVRDDRPSPWAKNVACLDYSVAKGGYLCAYRWDGERVLDENRFVRVDP